MVTLSKREKDLCADGLRESRETIPSPEVVRQLAAEIRKSWPAQERRRRADLARRMFLRQFGDGGR